MKFSCCKLDLEELNQVTKGKIELDEVISLFKLIAHPIRLKILQLLVVESEICTCELTDLYDEPQPSITKQLTRLKKENILAARKVTFKQSNGGDWLKEENPDGRWTAYRIVEDKRKLISYLLQPFIDEKFRTKVVKITTNCD